MNIYLLKAINPVGWESYNGHVVRANTEIEARDMCQAIARDESKIKVGSDGYSLVFAADDTEYLHPLRESFWTDPSKATCEVVGERPDYWDPFETDSKPVILLSSFVAG